MVGVQQRNGHGNEALFRRSGVRKGTLPYPPYTGNSRYAREEPCARSDDHPTRSRAVFTQGGRPRPPVR